MPNFYLRRFADVDALKKMRNDNLLALITPYRAYLEGRGLAWPDGTPLDHASLAEILINPDESIPARFVDTLYVIDEMATEQGMEDLLEVAQEHGIELSNGHESTPADIAVEMWLNAPDLVEEKHGEQFLFRPRSMESFQGVAKSVKRFTAPTKGDLRLLEDDLRQWFEDKQRGQYARVFVYPREGDCFFLVRHGDPLKREGSLKDGKPESVCYRPEKHDVVVFVPEHNELRVNAITKGEKDLYRAKFGLRLFGDEDYFPGDGKYTLEPLKVDGENSLICTDVEGMEWVRLKEVRFLYSDPNRTTLTIKSADVFSALNGEVIAFPDDALIISASFAVKFEKHANPRTVVIRPRNRAQFTRDSDAPLVEEWLKKRGFIKTRVEQDYAEDSEILAGA